MQLRMPHTSPSPADAPRQASRILLIEDDTGLATLVADYLSKHDIEVVCESRGDRAMERIFKEQPNLIVLDVMLPGKDGFEICRELRAEGNEIPVIMLTAREEDFDQVLGLELGADDYLAKPVQPRVLLAHIKAILRRLGNSDRVSNEGEALQFGKLRIHRIAREVALGGRDIDLTTAEFDLLWLLATNAGKVLSRNEILKALRGLDYDGTDRSIDSRVSRLRRKLGDDVAPSSRIKTIRPHGYLFSPSAW
jgi:two-component system OmpR family response regulator/two-component system response regulator RstA